MGAARTALPLSRGSSDGATEAGGAPTGHSAAWGAGGRGLSREKRRPDPAPGTWEWRRGRGAPTRPSGKSCSAPGTPQAASADIPGRPEAKGPGRPTGTAPAQVASPRVRGSPPTPDARAADTSAELQRRGSRRTARWPAAAAPCRSRRTHLFRGGGAWAPGRAARASASPGPLPCPRPLAAVPEPVSAPRPGLTGSEGFERVSSRGPGPQPGPWEGSGALGAASPRVGCGRPLAGAPRAHSPARGAGRGRRRARLRALRSARSARWRGARPVAGLGPGGRAGAAPLLAARPGLALRSGLAGPRRSLARSLCSRGRRRDGCSEPRGERRQLAARGRHLHSAAPPRPAPPPGRDPPGRHPAPAPPVRGCGWGLPRGGPPAPGKADPHPAPSPRLRGRRPRPAPALSLGGCTAHCAWCLPGRSTPRREGRARLAAGSPAHLRTPGRVAPSTPRRPAARQSRCAGPRTAPDAQQVAVQPLGRLAPLVLPTPSSPRRPGCPAPRGLPAARLFQASGPRDPPCIVPCPRAASQAGLPSYRGHLLSNGLVITQGPAMSGKGPSSPLPKAMASPAWTSLSPAQALC